MFIQGRTIIVEYFEPSNVSSNFYLEISRVGYFFRGFEDYFEPLIRLPYKTPNYAKADPCQVDVACTPESNGWDDQINAVVHFTFNPVGNLVSVCSGSVINNTANDCAPYILTAWHCGDHTTNQSLTDYTWYWNYQKSSCSPNSNGTDPSKGNETMINGNIIATSGAGTLNNPPGNSQLAGSDFSLVELNSNIPQSYNAFYAGWDRRNIAATSGVGIHHPVGSAKKYLLMDLL